MNKYMKIISSNKTLAEKCIKAETFLSRLVGLMFKDKLTNYDSLYIPKCKSIHTCFMKFPIDVLFINNENKIVKIYRNLKPYRFTKIIFKSSYVIEFVGGKLPDDIKTNDYIEIQNV